MSQSNQREKLLVVGNGMAGVRLCEEIAKVCPDRFTVAICGAEPVPGYNRVLLSSHLAGDVSREDIALRDSNWYSNQGYTLRTRAEVVSIDTGRGLAYLADGNAEAFDKLVFATGSTPIRLPKPGMTLPGVMAFRDLADVAAMRKLSAAAAEVVVIGGGLLGIEAAYGLARCGAKVTLVHLMDRLMERQLDGPAAALLRKAIVRKGIRVELGADTARVLGTDRAEGLELADGRVLPAQAVVCAIGIRANSGLAKEAGIAVNRGIVVDDAMRTSVPHIYAVGECAEHSGTVYGLVEPAYAQAKVIARQLAGDISARYGGTTLSTNLKVSGLGVFSAGDFTGGPETQASVMEDSAAGTYRKLVFDQSRLVGAVLVGDTTDALFYRDLIRSGQDIATARGSLIFGQDFASGMALQAA